MCKVLLLSEDKSKETYGALQTLLLSMAKFLCSELDTRRLSFHPKEYGGMRAISVANRWKSTNPEDRDDIRRFLNAIAGQLVEDRFVFFHFDGDKAWADRSKSENVVQFDDKVISRVRMIVELKYKKDALELDAVESATSKAMARLIVMTPFYSVEAWLFQNFAKAKAALKGLKNSKPSHLETLTEWETDPAKIEEVVKIKEKLGLGTNHHQELAEQFPVSDVYDVGKSFKAFCDTLLKTSLIEKLNKQPDH